MTIDLPTVAAFVGVVGVVVGVIIELYRTRLRVKELEIADKQSKEFMAAFRDMVAASQAGVRIQQSQITATQGAFWAQQSAQQRAIQIQEQNANHARLMNWLGFGLRVYDRYRASHLSDEDDE